MHQVKRYTKIVRTRDGGSAFEDAELHLDEQEISPGVPPMLVGRLSPSAAGALFILSPHTFGSDRHPAPRRQWVVPLCGTLEVQVTTGERRRFAPGDLVFAADTTGLGHVTVSVGEPPFYGLFIPASDSALLRDLRDPGRPPAPRPTQRITSRRKGRPP
jgi:hypothetical protein